MIQNTTKLLVLSFSLMSFNLAAQVGEVGVNTLNEASARFPLRNLDRPSVMPSGTINIDTRASVSNLKTIGLSAATKFGLAKSLEGHFSYDGITFNKFEIKKKIAVGAKYNYLSVPHLSGSLTASLPFYILADAEIVQNMVFGAPTIFYNDVMAAGILGNLLDLNMRPSISAKVNFNVWYGYQITDNIWADISSSFGRIELVNEKNQAEVKKAAFWQELPLELSALYSFTNAYDLGASFGMGNTFKPSSSLNFGLVFSMRAGRLFS